MISADGWRRVGAEPGDQELAECLDRIGSLYELEHGALTRFARSRVDNEAVAEEITQEAFARLVRVASGGSMPDTPLAWLYRVVANLAASHGRRQRTASRPLRKESCPDPPSPDRLVLDAERSRDLNECLGQLSRDGRTAVVLAAHGYTGHEIAQALGRTQLATRVLLCRSRSRLRRMLTQLSVAAAC